MIPSQPLYPVRARALILLIVVGSVGQWLILSLRLPFFESLSGWFWKGHYTPLHAPMVLAFPVLSAAGVMALIHRHPNRTRLHLLLLVLLGYVLQAGFAAAEGRGLEALRDRMRAGGPSEFARIAADRPSPWRVATRYEEVLKTGEIPDSVYLKTKPPGTLLLYILAERCTGAFFRGEASADERRLNLATFASYTFPLLACLAIVPLYWLSKMLLGKEAALLAPLLFLFAPSVILITLSLDQAVFPTILLTSVGLSVHAVIRDNVRIGFLSGIAVFLATFVSFSLIPAPALAILFALSFLVRHGPEQASVRRVGRFVLAFFAGIGVTSIAFKLLFGYDAVSRFQNSMVVHVTTKYYNPSLRTTLLYAVLNCLEFAWWIGLPIAALALAGVTISLRRLAGSRPATMDRFCLALVATVLLLGLFGKTKGESARLWLSLVPLACLMAARAWPVPCFRSFRGFLYLIATLQFLSVLFFKLYQDA